MACAAARLALILRIVVATATLRQCGNSSQIEIHGNRGLPHNSLRLIYERKTEGISHHDFAAGARMTHWFDQMLGGVRGRRYVSVQQLAEPNLPSRDQFVPRPPASLMLYSSCPSTGRRGIHARSRNPACHNRVPPGHARSTRFGDHIMTTDSWESALNGGSHTAAMPGALRLALDQRDGEIRRLPGRRARLFRPVRGSLRIPLPARRLGDEAPRVLLSPDGRTAYERRLSQVTLEEIVRSYPMRTFSRRNGQSNKPVAFYSRTVGDLVSCESQHERRFVLLADFHERVTHIAAQPFTLEFPNGGELSSHTPDFALICSCGAIIIVDVKWHLKPLNEDAVRRHEIVRRTLATAGMQHFVWTDAPLTVTENLANFAAARVPDTMMADLAPKLLSMHRQGLRVQALLDAASNTHGIATMVGLVVLRRMVWEHQLEVDLGVPFSTESELMLP